MDANVKSAEAVSKALKGRNLPDWHRQRLTAVSLGLKGDMTLARIAENTGSSVSSLLRWFKAYRAGGVERLLVREKGRGVAPMLDEKAQGRLKEAVRENNFRRGADAQAWMAKHLKVEASLSSVYRFMGKSSRG